MADERIERFREWAGKLGDDKYARAQRREMLMVTSVDASGGQTRTATGPLVQSDGTLSAAEFTVTMGGKTAARGEFLIVGRPADQAVGAELVYIEHAESPYPGAGLVVVDADLPSPTNLVVTSVLVALPGSITARATVTFTAVPARYQPSGYTISFRIDGGTWGDRHVPHIGGSQECVLGSDFPPGAIIDVHARARYNWAGAESVPTADVTETLAADTSSAGTISAIAVDTSVPNTLTVKPTASITPELFRGIQWEINDAATGAADITTSPSPSLDWTPLVVGPGTFYVAARTVSKSGTLGARFPGTGFQGPYTVEDLSAHLDVTPPGTMGAPSLAVRSAQFADNTWHGFLTVTRPAYTPPSDIAAYEISIVVDDGRAFNVEIPATMTEWDGEVGFGEFTVAMRARDVAGNRPAFSPTAVIANDPPEFLGAAPTVTTASRGAGIYVSWSAVTNANHYEVQRATDSGGTGAATIGLSDTRWFFDPLTSDTIILPTYYYRARAIGVDDGVALNGTWSSWVAGTAGAVDAQNLRALSIVAGLIAADAITANKIQAGAITTGKLAADVIISSIIRTASSGNRFEIRGAGVTDAERIRFYETIASVDRERMRLTGAGLTVFGDSAQGDITLNRNASGRGQLVAHGVTIGHDGVPYLSVTLGPYGGYNGELRFGGGGQSGKWSQGDLGGGISTDWMGDPTIGWVTAETGGYPLMSFVNEYGGRKTAIYDDGVAAYSNSQEVRLAKDSTTARWDNFISKGLIGGALQNYYQPSGGYVLTAYTGNVLGTGAGAVSPLASFQQATPNYLSLRIMGYRGQASGADWQDARMLLGTDVDNSGFVGGSLQLGARGYASFWALGTGGTADIYKDAANSRITTALALHVGGALSKTSGSFVIPDPTPGREGYELRHCFVEGPTAGTNLYLYRVAFGPRGGGLAVTDSEGLPVAGATIARVAEGVAKWAVTIPLPDYWPHLNTPQAALAHNTGDGWGRCKVRVAADLASMVLEVEEGGEYTIDLRGTRKDAAALAWWGRRGVRKTKGQRWENEGTMARRAATLDARKRRDETPPPMTTFPPITPLAPLGRRPQQGVDDGAQSAFPAGV